MKVVDVPKPEMSDYGKTQFATEQAFNSLVQQAKKLGLQVGPCSGLVYLPTQELTRDFQFACRNILMALQPRAMSK